MATLGKSNTMYEEGSGRVMGFVDRSGREQLLGALPKRRVSGVTTITPADIGYSVMHLSADTTARTWPVQANSVAPYADGAAITFEVQPGAGTITLTFTDSAYLAGPGTTGNRTLPANSTGTMLWDALALRWVISGTGIV